MIHHPHLAAACDHSSSAHLRALEALSLQGAQVTGLTDEAQEKVRQALAFHRASIDALSLTLTQGSAHQRIQQALASTAAARLKSRSP